MRSTAETPIEAVRNALVDQRIHREVVVVAYSGGPDSTALLRAVSALRAELELTVVAAYLDHGLQDRTNREAERAIVESGARTMADRLVLEEVPAGSLRDQARAGRESLEAAARDRRYDFLARVGEDVGAHWVLTAHHADDQAETVIMRLLRGAGIAGLAGIPRMRPLTPRLNLLRPMLSIPKASVADFLASEGLEFATDPSNSFLGFERNKVRHSVLPAVRCAFPDAVATIVRAAERYRDAASFIGHAAAEAVRWKPTKNGYTTIADDFWSAHPALRVESLLAVMNQAGVARRVSSGMLRAVQSRPERGGIVLEGAGWTLYQVSGRLYWQRAVARHGESGYLFRVSAGTHPFEVRLPFPTERDRMVSLSGVREPGDIVVRSRRPGDSVTTAGKRKELKRLFQAAAVPAAARSLIPVVEDRSGILAVVGSVLGFADVFADRCAEVRRSEERTIEILFPTAIG